MYECRVDEDSPWRFCYADHCGNERRISERVDPLIRLEYYREKLEAGEELNDLERADLDALTEMMAEMVRQFVEVVKRELAPALEKFAKLFNEALASIQETVKKSDIQMILNASSQVTATLPPELRPSSRWEDRS